MLNAATVITKRMMWVHIRLVKGCFDIGESSAVINTSMGDNSMVISTDAENQAHEKGLYTIP